MRNHLLRISHRSLVYLLIALLLMLAMIFSAGFFSVAHIVIPDIFYLMLAGLVFILDAIIFFFMLMQYICDKRLLYVLMLGVAFLGSDIYCVAAVVLAVRTMSADIPIVSTLNDLGIFYLFRQIGFILPMAMALYYSWKLDQNIRPTSRDILYLWIMIIFLIILAVWSYNLSSYNPQLSLNLMMKIPGAEGTPWEEYYGYLVIGAWLILLLSIIWLTDLKNLLWMSMAAFTLSNLFGNIILIRLGERNFPIWYLSRAIEVICTFFVIIVLLYDIFLLHKRTTQLSVRDPLTRVYNRAWFYHELQFAVTARMPLSVMILDIDHFKRINDRYGHPVGDHVLQSIVGIVKSAIRETDMLARIGGEEFAILMTNTTHQIALKVAERARAAVADESKASKVWQIPEAMTISIGLFSTRDNRWSADECICYADKALYQAKNNGRNQVKALNEITDCLPALNDLRH